MNKLLAATTAQYPLGLPGGRKLHRVEEGQYAGRLLAVYAEGPATIRCRWADPPYRTWSDPVTLAADNSDQPFASVMAADGGAHLAYAESGTGHLVSKELVFEAGEWWADYKVGVYDGALCSAPALLRDVNGVLWVAFARSVGAFKTLSVKRSIDNGAAWGSGPSDTGDTLASGLSSTFVTLAAGPTTLHAVYTLGAFDLMHRTRPLAGGAWSDEAAVAAGAGLDAHLDIAISDSGALGVVFDAGGLRYREFNGASWEAVVVLDDAGGRSPQAHFDGETPVVAYVSDASESLGQLLYTHRYTGVFSTPAPLDKGARVFDSVVLYDASSGSYADLTTAAASAIPGDLFHPESGVLFGGEGDVLYLGMDTPVRFSRILLSSAGSGGAVQYSYWDGAHWRSFTPAAGAYAFDAADRELLLWNDYMSLPDDWQKCPVDGVSRFWVQIKVTTAFTAPPVGSRITAITDIKSVAVRR